MHRLASSRATSLARLLLCTAGLCVSSPLHAAELWPLTKVRLTVVQWVPAKGEFQRWDAINGEYVIADDGTVPLPVLGQIATRGMTSDEVAREVASRLQTRLGLASMPDTSIEIVSYPPIYLVGDVATPGAFEFRPGMTVLQALASGGGQRRGVADQDEKRLHLVADLHAADEALLRARARDARLKAELNGAQAISFPAEVTGHLDAELANAVMQEEQMIFAARARELDRQAASLEDLATLLKREIETLKARLTDLDTVIASAEQELAGVESLVKKGIASVSRRTELERQVLDARFDRLTQLTAILRAEQALSQANREAAQLVDARKTQITLDLQEAQERLGELALKEATSQRLLLSIETESIAAQTATLDYTIVRHGPDGLIELAADETTVLLPDDVVKVRLGTARTRPGPEIAGLEPGPDDL
jgi:polysaccharide export outer membrane protein